MDPTRYTQNAMILYVPAEKSQVHVLDSRDLWAEELHTQVATAFDALKARNFSFGGSSGFATLSTNGAAPLPVFRAGSYKYSMAKDVDELLTFDRKQFHLSDAVLEELLKQYPPFGSSAASQRPPSSFLLLQFDAASHGSYHPLMYVYPQQEPQPGHPDTTLPSPGGPPESKRRLVG